MHIPEHILNKYSYKLALPEQEPRRGEHKAPGAAYLAVLGCLLLCLFFQFSAPLAAQAQNPREAFARAMSRFEALSTDKVRGMQREPWEKLEKEFAAIHAVRGQFAGEAFFYQARSREELADRSKNRGDYQESIRLYSRMAQTWPNHALADNALYNQAMIFSGPLKDKKSAVKILDQLILQYPTGDMVKEAVILRERLENGGTAGAGRSAAPAPRLAPRPATGRTAMSAPPQAQGGSQPNYGVLNAPTRSEPAARTAPPEQAAQAGRATLADRAGQTGSNAVTAQTAPQAASTSQAAPQATTQAQQSKQREQYQTAAEAWKQLISGKHPRSAHRDVWEALEKDFKSAREAAPAGSYADKAAYQAARCREELAARSKSAADWKEAAAQFSRLAANYPKSSLADDSLYAAALIQADKLNSPAQAKRECAEILEKYPDGDMIQKTRALLQRLPGSGGQAPTRPGSAPAATTGAASGTARGTASVTTPGTVPGAGQVTTAAAGQSGATVNQGANAAASGKPAQGAATAATPASTAAGASNKPGTSGKPATSGTSATGGTQAASGATGVKGLKAPANGAVLSHMSWQGDASKFTLTIELPGSAKYRRNTLPPSEGNGTARIQLDLLNTRLDPKVQKQLQYSGLPIRAIRVNQADKTTARVVLEADGARSYKVNVLRNPYRIQVEVSAKSMLPGGHDLSKINAATGATAGSGAAAGAATGSGGPRRSNGSIVEQLGLGVKTIVLDAGHGGKDPGAIGNGVTERTYTLELAKMLGQRLQKKGFTVIYTRSGNNYVALKDRTTLANDKKADIFISIHVNSSTNKKLSGVETYYLDTARSNAASVVAARENAVDVNATSDLQFILSDLTRNTKLEESKALAALVQERTMKQLQKGGFSVKNNGVRSAPFYVLMGARMPAFLIEVGYLSNSSDASRLKNKKYMERLADGIADGMVAYRSKINSLKP